MARTILVINLGWEQRRLLTLLAARGEQLVGVHYDDGWESGIHFDRVEVCDLHDLARIAALADEVDADAVVAEQCDYGMFAAALVSARRGLPGPSLEAVQVAMDKALQRQRAQERKILQPAFRICAFPEDAFSAAGELGYPVVVKPVDNRGSFGVNRVEAETQLRDAVLEALIHSRSRRFIVEKYVSGTQIIAEGYVHRGGRHQTLAIGSKSMRRIGTRQIADDIVFPAEIPDDTFAHAVAHNDRTIQALGYDFGPTSAEYRIDKDGQLWLLEAAHRGGGVMIASHIVPAVSGTDVTKLLIADCLGEVDTAAIGAPTHDAAFMRYLLYRPGLVASVEGLDTAAGMPGVEALRWYGIGSGDTIRDPCNDAERQGMLIALGATPTEARASAESAASCIRVVYDQSEAHIH